MARSRFLVGAAVLVYINNRMFARVSHLNWDVSSSHREIRCVDSVAPAELALTQSSVSGTMEIYRLRQDGGIEAAGMIGTWNDMTRSKYFSILVLDRATDSVLFQADRCSVDRQSWTINRGLITGTISFKALAWNNETPDSST